MVSTTLIPYPKLDLCQNNPFRGNCPKTGDSHPRPQILQKNQIWLFHNIRLVDRNPKWSQWPRSHMPSLIYVKITHFGVIAPKRGILAPNGGFSPQTLEFATTIYFPIQKSIIKSQHGLSHLKCYEKLKKMFLLTSFWEPITWTHFSPPFCFDQDQGVMYRKNKYIRDFHP